MAEKAALLESYLSCHVCSETFKDPVSLSCNHSFCSSCLQKFWEQTRNKNCPVCRRRSSKDTLVINFTLKELADSFAGRQKSGSFEAEKGQKSVMMVCNKHQEDPKLFCKDEQRVVCPVCEFSLHQKHKVVPVEQAVRELKEQLRSDLKSLQDKRNKHKHVKKKYNEMTGQVKMQLLSTETQIRAEFNKLHQFLIKEEKSRLAALREEEEQKRKTISREMKRIQEQISSLSDSISAVEEDLQKDNVSFLSTYKDTQTRARTQSSLSDPQLVSGALIDVAKHLGNLSFRVWDKVKDRMKDQVHFSPDILDPNTAAPSLHLSDDLTSVRREDMIQLPRSLLTNNNIGPVSCSEDYRVCYTYPDTADPNNNNESTYDSDTEVNMSTMVTMPSTTRTMPSTTTRTMPSTTRTMPSTTTRTMPLTTKRKMPSTTRTMPLPNNNESTYESETEVNMSTMVTMLSTTRTMPITTTRTMPSPNTVSKESELNRTETDCDECC